MYTQVCYLFIVFFIVVDGLEPYYFIGECSLPTKDGKIIDCVRFFDCEKAKLDYLQRLINPLECGLDGNGDLLVCCSSSGERAKKPGDFAKNACIKWRYMIRLPSDRREVAGGVKAKRKEFRHMALLGFDNKGEKKWSCGGSLISEQFVLTAAHCLYHSTFGLIKYIRLGELDYSTNNDKSNFQDFTVLKSYRHPNYNSSYPYNDIALLKLDRPAIIDEYVRPTCLNTEKEVDLSEGRLVVSGWGDTDFGAASGSSHLRKAAVVHVQQEECNEVYTGSYYKGKKLEKGIIEELQLCAGSHVDANDTCNGDSGGPLELRRKGFSKGFSTIIGVTSYGKACGFRIPGVYTRVSSFIDWIENIVWKGYE